MHARPVRSRIFLPVVKYGLVSDDWPWVCAISFLGFFLPFLFGKFVAPVSFLRVPIHFWIGFLASALSYSFFFWMRRGRRPHWFQHNVNTLVESPVRRRALPTDWGTRPRLWIKEK